MDSAAARIENTVFICYRRTDRWLAWAVFRELVQHGYDVFIDYKGIGPGDFERAIVDNIRARAHFLVLLTPDALDRCGDPDDWVRREIETALDAKRNIVPLLLDGFRLEAPDAARRLQGSLAPLRRYQGLTVPDGYFEEAMDRLRGNFLTIPVETVLHPAPAHARAVAREQRDAALHEPPTEGDKGNGRAAPVARSPLAQTHTRKPGGKGQTARESQRPAPNPSPPEPSNRVDSAALMFKRGQECLGQDDAEAAKCFRRAAEQGHADAQANLGVMYTVGRGGLAKDDAEAIRWLRKSAAQGSASGQANLGAMFEQGRGVPQDDVEAVKWFRKAADQGSAYAQTRLGSMSSQGRGGLTRDPVEAAKWYRQAADRGFAEAQATLGVMYMHGHGGVAKDDTEAVRWLRRAVEQDDPIAQSNLGAMYALGRGGLPKDEREAVRWLRKSAEQGNAGAQSNLGIMYEEGRGGLAKDQTEAAKWFRLAAEQGETQALTHLGDMYKEVGGVVFKAFDRLLSPKHSVKGDDAEAAKWLVKAAEKGVAKAQYDLGVMYLLGRGGLAKNQTEAIKWFQKAAEQGNASAQLMVGTHFENGLGGLPKSRADAVRHYRESAAQGNADAEKALIRLGERR
jgi:TPR repeat protein